MQEQGERGIVARRERGTLAVPVLLVFTSVLWTGLTLMFVILAKRAEGLREHYVVAALICGGMLGVGALGMIVGVTDLWRRRRALVLQRRFDQRPPPQPSPGVPGEGEEERSGAVVIG